MTVPAAPPGGPLAAPSSAANQNTQSALMGFVHRRRRGAELFLLVIALAVGVGGYAAVGLGVEDKIPADIVAYGGWLAALMVGAHVAVRLVAPYADPVLLPVVAALNGLGLALIHRIDLAKDATFARQQLTWMTLGVLLFVATLVILRDHRVLARFTYTSGLLAIALLVAPMAPGLGYEVNGARIWIGVGPFNFQPGEVAKVLLVVAFAGYLVLHRDALALAGRRVLFVDLPRGRDLGPILVMWLISLGILVFQRDLGSSLLFFGLFLLMLYVATERAGWIVVGAGLFALGTVAGYHFFGHVRVRVNTWLHPFEYYDGPPGANSYQLVESLFGLAWGGEIGRGLGQGDPARVPEASSDFIMAALGEELGLTGVIAVLLLYGLIVERALRAALISRDNFGKLMATGLAGIFALQLFVVVGGVTRLIPLTGLTTSFLSYGGSSLVASWVVVALLLRISDQARRPLPDLTSSGDDQPDDQATQVIKGVGR
jgi:cell division protein FtsW (lipid II flippase)